MMTAGSTRKHVWLASYPKSGNTWMRIALSSLADGGGPVDINHLRKDIGRMLAERQYLDEALDVDSSDLSAEEAILLRPKLYDYLQTPSRPWTIWKVHDRWERTADGETIFPATPTIATLYLVRDPRDVAVSYSHHFGVDIDKVIDIMADTGYRVAASMSSSHHHLPQTYSSWSDHVSSWIDRSDLAPLVIRYEEMVADLGDVLTRVSMALRWNKTTTEIAGAVAATRFERLRSQERSEGFLESPPSRRAFFRRGVAGGWRDTLSPIQAARIEKDHGKMMERLGYL